jgi:hypothetical protein
MRSRIGLLALACTSTASVMAGAWAFAAAIPPGRQHRLTIEGENNLTFLPQLGLPPLKVDYKAKVEYIIDTRLGKGPKAASTEPSSEEVAEKKPVAKAGGSSSRAKAKKGENPASKVSGAVDLSLHSTEMNFRQNGLSVVEARMSRARFQGRLLPDAPVLNVSMNEAPPRLQEILKSYDSIAASLLVNDDDRVVNRRYRVEGPHRAIIETILSIHAPIPRDADYWESPTQLAMGHGQTAKGILRFDKIKKDNIKTEIKKDDASTNNKKDDVNLKDGPVAVDVVKVKVSGVLKAEGVIAGNLIKDGTYTVSGEQVYDSHTREWTSSRWSVVVKNELANQAGVTVAQASGMMTVESRALAGASPPTVDSSVPKL